jgi:hypothetical protein
MPHLESSRFGDPARSGSILLGMPQSGSPSHCVPARPCGRGTPSSRRSSVWMPCALDFARARPGRSRVPAPALSRAPPLVPTALRRDAIRSLQCPNCLRIKWLGLQPLPATPFPSLCGVRTPIGLPHNEGLAIRAVPGPFSPLCGIRPPIGVPHNERIGDPGGSGPFPPLLVTSTPLGVNNNERFGHPDASGATLPILHHPVGLNNNGRFGRPDASRAAPLIVRQGAQDDHLRAMGGDHLEAAGRAGNVEP